MDSATSDKDPLATDLWQFALTFWQLPGVEDSCLTLQQRGWSVTRILCAGWLTTQGRTYDGNEPDALSQWRLQKTEVIRNLRQSIGKQDPDLKELRGLLAKAELAAEKIELHRAWVWLQGQAPGLATNVPKETLALDNFRASAPLDEDTDGDDIQHRITFLAKQVYRAC